MDIKTERQQQGKPISIGRSHRLYTGAYFLVALLAFCAYSLLHYHVFSVALAIERTVSKILLTVGVVAAILGTTHLLENILQRNVHNRAGRYNLVRVIRLLTFLLVALVIISFINANWYTAAVSLGLISLILGFALQTPIASLIGWFYIILRTPYRVGDRIQVGSFTGDVVEIQYLDTTLWEFAGDYMTNDLPSGRLIRFPNSQVFSSEIYNYSWQKFPYIWNEIPFHVAYESDLTVVEARMREIAKEVLGQKMDEKVQELRNVISATPIDEAQIKDYPFVQFRINANTWVEVLLIYLVEPKRSGAMRSELIKRILKELAASPDQIMFPKTNAR